MLTTLLFLTTTMATRITVTDFGATPNSGKDATPPFQRAIAAAKAAPGPVTLVVPAGRYDFFSDHATRRPCYYSNATEPNSDAVRTIAIDLSGLKNLTVEGNGARLVMRGNMSMLVAEHCQNLKLKGLEFDFARPTVSEVKAIEKGDGYWIGEVNPESTYRIVDGRIEWYGENWKSGHNLVQHDDPVAKTVWRGQDPTEGMTKLTELAPRRMRFDVPAKALNPVVVGRTYQFRDTFRDETGMWFNRSQNVALEDVRILAMAGFGVLFQYVHNVDIQRLRVEPAEGRTTVSAGDILHFSGCRGRVRVRESILTAAHDDAINIHGTHLRVMARVRERQIRVRFMHPQTWGFAAFLAGDEIEFVRKDSLQNFGKAKVAKVEMTEDKQEQILTLDRAAPVDLKLDSDAVENVTWTPSVEVQNCEIAKVPTRGILITTRRPSKIVGNWFFRTPMHAILLEDDAAGWYESGPVHDLLIQGNTFVECANEVVHINPQNSVHAGPVHRNIRIERNLFTLAHPIAIAAKSADRVWISHNRFQTKNRPEELIRATNTTHLEDRANQIEKL